MRSRSRSRASVGFCPVGWNGAMKTPNRSGQSIRSCYRLLTGRSRDGDEPTGAGGRLSDVRRFLVLALVLVVTSCSSRDDSRPAASTTTTTLTALGRDCQQAADTLEFAV